MESLKRMSIAKNAVRPGMLNLPTLGEVPMKRVIFQGYPLLPLPFVIALILLTHILRKGKPGCAFQTGEMINYLLFMDDLKLYSTREMARILLSRQYKHLVRILECKLGSRNEPWW